MEKKTEPKERSVIVAVAGYFTVQWLVQTIAAWGLTLWLTKLWKDWKSKRKN